MLIIIPHYGKDQYLKDLFVSLDLDPKVLRLEQQETIYPFKYGHIYVWNNNISNVGWTKANNFGIQHGLRIGEDVFWLLNNDTRVEDLDAFYAAVSDELANNPSTGVIGNMILSMDDETFIHHGGTGPCFPAGVHKVGRRNLGELNERTREKWVTGASLLLTLPCVEQIGLLDEGFVNYGSDSDICYRARAAGFSVVYLPVAVSHHIGQSANPTPEQQQVLKRDMLHFHNKWISGQLFKDLDGEVFNES